MKNDAFTQLTLWPEGDLPEPKVLSTDGNSDETYQGDDKQKGESAAYTQLTLPGCGLEEVD